MLPPISEALGILDVAFVNSDGNPTPGTMRRAIQIMVDHISYQNVQLSRVEDILAAYGNPTQPGGTVWTKLAGKAEASRVQQLEEQVDEQLNVMCAMRTKQSESDLRAEEQAARMELLREQVAALEAKLGSGPAPHRSHVQVCPAGSHPGDISARAAAAAASVASGSAQWTALGGASGGGHHGSSVMERLGFMERRVEAMSAAMHRGEDNLSSMGSRVRELEPRVEGQLANLRSDIKQALALAAASARAEAEAEASSRSKDTEKRVMSKMHGLEEALEARVASVSTKVGTSLSQELDKRFLGLYDHVDLQVSGLRGDLERVQNDKADTISLEAYTTRVSTLFEQVAGALSADVREVSSSCSKSLAVLQSELAALASTKADKVAAGSVMDAHAAALGSLRENVAVLERTIAAHPDTVEAVRAEVRVVSKDLEQAQRSISGLNSAMAATGSAIELQGHKTGSLSHKLQQMVVDVGRLRAMVYGDANPTGAEGGGSSPGAPLSLTARISGLEAGASELAACVACKADEGLVREAERRLAALGRQAESASEGVRALTQSTGKRVDEHAAAIQRLTLAVNSHMDERPTNSTVRHMIEASLLEGGEKLGSALLPVWDAVKALQAGLRDSINEARNAAGQALVLQQHQEELRLRVAGEKGAMAALASRAVAEEVLPLLLAPSTGLGARMEAMEADMRSTRAQLEVASELQDKQSGRSTALEGQLSAHAMAVKQAAHAQRGELLSVIGALEVESRQRAEGLEQALRTNTLELEAVRNSIPSPEQASATSEIVARREISRHKEQEEARWQAWLEQYSRQLERLPSKGELQDGLARVSAIAKQASLEAETATTVAAGAEGRALEAAEQRVQGCELALSANAARIEALERLAATAATHEALVSLEQALQNKADITELEVRSRQCEAAAQHAVQLLRSDLQAEVAKKLDMRTFLASSASANATAVAAAAAGAYCPVPHPGPPPTSHSFPANHSSACVHPAPPLPHPHMHSTAHPPAPTYSAPPPYIPPPSTTAPPRPPHLPHPSSFPPTHAPPPPTSQPPSLPLPPPPLEPVQPPVPLHSQQHLPQFTAPRGSHNSGVQHQQPPTTATGSRQYSECPPDTAAAAAAGDGGGSRHSSRSSGGGSSLVEAQRRVGGLSGDSGNPGVQPAGVSSSPTRSHSHASSRQGDVGREGGQQHRQQQAQQQQLLQLLQQQQRKQQQEEEVAAAARSASVSAAPGGTALGPPSSYSSIPGARPVQSWQVVPTSTPSHAYPQGSSRPPSQPSSPHHQQQVLHQIAAAESLLSGARQGNHHHTTTTILSPSKHYGSHGLPAQLPLPVAAHHHGEPALGLGSAAAAAAITRLGERLKASQADGRGRPVTKGRTSKGVKGG